MRNGKLNPKNRIFLVEDHSLFRQALRKLIASEPNLEVVGEASDGLEAIRTVAKIQPDVVILDLSMPRCNGMDALKEIRKISSEIRIMILTAYENEEYVFNAFRLGAKAYMVKDIAFAELLLAIHEVQNGNYYISPGVCRPLIHEYLKNRDCFPPFERLTRREQNFLRLWGENFNDEEIARILSVRVNTVEKRRRKVMKTLRITSHAELIFFAKKRLSDGQC